MATTAAQILTRAATVLQDATFVRWLLPELADWLNEAQRAIVLAKPSANAVTVDIAMVEGTLQSLGAEERLFLLRLPRNLKGASAPFTGGRAIRPTARATLDASQPNWHDGDESCGGSRFRSEVRQVIYDESSPKTFWVFPGNDGTGRVEAVVSVLPTMIATAGTEITSYGGAIGLPEPYSPVILDYILARAFSKDDIAADVTRAQLHYRMFAEALGVKAQAESSNSLNARVGLVRT